ncbi:hypothetical protein K1F50_15915 [Muricauda oceani]|uniref:Uncharacterized protein n=1 Tax=Flagellimonas oceani TaxID=2698672 RepID=A0A6G7J0D1_9FLAO|nr:hypothetical protein [Allomuricauda oceani]MBW8244296.1 hypothetical protein [Allomuricauda oceani]QII44058.1 hypothetical protein GVT53_05020 [Allomuricauda oceani]
MRNWTIILFLLLTLTIYGQTKFDKSKISKETNKIAQDIEEINMVMSSAVGFAGVRPEQYDNFMKLKSMATSDELKELTSHPNPTVRSYAFWALSYDHSVDPYPIVLNHINDSKFVNTQFGCIVSGESVGDFFINVVTLGRIDLDSKKLDSVQFATLDSILIYTPNNLSAKSAAINRAEPTESLYPKIRELVVKENDQTALVTLAKYQKEQDIELIQNNKTKSKFDEGGFFYTYKAISQFPHSDFFPLLEKNLEKTLDNTHFSTEWRELYKAIASYKNDKAKELLLVPFTQVKHNNIRKYHIDFVFSALREFKDPIYEDLFWKLWTEEKRINPDVFKYLSSTNPEKTFELTKESLKNTDGLYSANISLNFNDFDASENLTSTMLDLALKQDKEFGFEVIRKNIEEANVNLFPIFADKTAELKDKSFIEPLFDRLETEWNAHIYLKAAQALIAYEDSDVNQRILKTVKKNKNLRKDWGGDALDKLMKDNNIK